ncbi:MAG: hypothetical protein MZW92_27710 [Comamonadaceae bacterium]|nr:hypothetical protein [Comamonadaceae bacterium]
MTLELDSVNRKIFGVNTSLLAFSGSGVTTELNTPQTGLTTLTFPWIAGYVDYQGDQDWFLMDFQPLDTSTSWYYEIYVDFYAPAADTEYVWKFYPDRNKNAVVSRPHQRVRRLCGQCGKAEQRPCHHEYQDTCQRVKAGSG